MSTARWLLHVDLDQFIAAVEILRHPELRGRPVVVGGRGDPTERGVVSTASYEAREYGVHSGLPLRTAARLCPSAVFLPVDREAYDAASVEVMAALRETGAVVEVFGWDEAFLAIDSDDPEAAALDVQARVLARTRLMCTVGIGENKLQAKLATGFGKPAGIFRLSSANWFELLGDLPPDALWGIGSRTARKLAEAGIATVRQLADADPAVMAQLFGPTIGPGLVRMGGGLGSTSVTSEPRIARSRSREVTFQQDLTDRDVARRELASLARRLGSEVVADPPVARVVLKIRYAPFVTTTHRAALKPPTSDVELIEQAALDAFDRFVSDRPVRLLGVRVEFVR